MELREWLLGPALQSGMIKFRRLRWPNEWAVPFEDVEVKVTIEGVESIGRATKSNFDVAFLVAAAEALERHFTKLIGEGNSGGIAVHSTQRQAAQNASRERVERELFLALFLSRTPPCELASVSVLAQGPHLLLAESLKNVGIEWICARLGSTPIGEVAISAAFGHSAPTPFGVVIGLGVGGTFETALMKALEETFANVVGLVSGELQAQALDYDTFDSRQRLNGDERFRWGLSRTCADFVKAWLGNSMLLSSSGVAMADEDVLIELVDASELWQTKSTSAPPLFFARASVPDGLTLRAVNGPRSPIVEERIRHLLGEGAALSGLAPYPPPIG